MDGIEEIQDTSRQPLYPSSFICHISVLWMGSSLSLARTWPKYPIPRMLLYSWSIWNDGPTRLNPRQVHSNITLRTGCSRRIELWLSQISEQRQETASTCRTRHSSVERHVSCDERRSKDDWTEEEEEEERWNIISVTCYAGGPEEGTADGKEKESGVELKVECD